MVPEVGRSEAGDEIEERGFAEPEEPRRARNSLLATERESFVDGADGSFAHGVVAGDAVELDGGIGDGHRGGVNS